jgi:TolB-like protein/Tfp pilus assembly protein PilF
VLFYEMVSGRLPFSGRTAYEVGSAILNDTPAALPGNVPPAIASCITRCLEKAREERPQRATDAKSELESIAAGGIPDDPVPGELPPPRDLRRPSASPSSWPATRVAAAAAAAGVLLSAMAVAGWQWTHGFGGPVAQPIRSIAVLPLENLSGDPSQDYFADGVTEALIGEFGRTAGLLVTSPTTTMRYKRTRLSVPEVARALKVGAVLRGSILRDGDQVRVAVTLVGWDDEPLWTDTYERPAREILALQRDVVRAATSRLAVSLTPEEDARWSRVRSVDPDVYESFLKGRYYWNKRTQASLATAVGHFNAAISADPTYAPAYVGLADCYSQLGTVMVASASPAEMRPRAVAAAIAALQIDPELGEAHAALAYARHYDWQWGAAEQGFQRAIDLAPNNALVRLWYANYLASRLRLKQAVTQVELARDLDPLSPVVMTNVGWTLSYSGRADEAAVAYREALGLDLDYIQAHMRLADLYAGLGQFEAALSESETATRLIGRSPSSLIGTVLIYAMAGRHREARRVLDEVLARAGTGYLPPFALAQPYVVLGDFDRAFELLERAYQERANGMVYLAVDPVFGPVHEDARYQDLLKRVGLR